MTAAIEYWVDFARRVDFECWDGWAYWDPPTADSADHAGWASDANSLVEPMIDRHPGRSSVSDPVLMPNRG